MISTNLLKKFSLIAALVLIGQFPNVPERNSLSFVASNEVIEVLSQPSTSFHQQIDTILENPKLVGGITGVSVRKADTGEILYSKNANVRLRPASNMKLLTGAAALNVLGPDYRFTTEVLTDGQLKGNLLQGNLYVKGKGDSTLLKTDLDQFVFALKEKGISTITGNLIADDSWYDSERYSQDLNWSDEHNHVGAQVSALTLSPNEDYDAGTVIVEVKAGGKVGEHPKVTVIPATDYVEISNHSKTVAAGGKKTLKVEREHGTNRIVLTGQMPMGEKKSRSWVAVWEPTGLVLDVFKKSLENHGIQLLETSERNYGQTPEDATMLVSKKSIPLDQLFIPFMKLSNNGHAEILVKEMGKIRQGEGSWRAGLDVMKQQMQEFGMQPNEIVLRDGSGMSHKNLVSADDLSTLLVTIQNKSWFPVFKAALPIAGEADRMVGGTLRYRMNNGALLGNVVAKTGSITGVSTLSGYVTAKDGTTLIFSVLVNNYVDGPVTPIEDSIVEVLVRYSSD